MLEIVTVGIESICCDIFFETFMKERYKKKKVFHIAIIVLLTVLLTILSMGIKSQFWIKSSIGIIIMVGLMLFLYQGKIGQVFFLAICYYGILLAIDSGIIIVLQYWMEGDANSIIQNVENKPILLILLKSVLFLCVVLINKRFSRENNYGAMRENEWIRFCFFPIFTIIAAFFMVVDESVGRKAALFLSVGLLVADIMLFYSIKDFANRVEVNQKNNLVQEHIRNQIEMYESMELSYNRQKKKVHEFKNHLDCIQGLLQKNKREEALSYVSKINNPAEQHMNYFSTKNPIVDVVINQKYQQAQEEGISMVVVMDELNTIPMEDKDLVVLLSNLLNNAIEACRKLESEKRMIKLKFVQDAEQIVISVRNPIEEQLTVIDNKVKTTKKNKKEHGIGLYNIGQVVDKYRGEGICSSNEGVFSYTIIFQKKEMNKV